MAKRASQYRRLTDFVYEGHTIEGLRRRPDGRFYAAVQPSKTFGKEPREAVTKFMLWQANGMHPEKPAPGFMFWRKAFRYLIIYHPQVAGEVLGVDKLKNLVSLTESVPLAGKPEFDWMRTILPQPDPLYPDEKWQPGLIQKVRSDIAGCRNPRLILQQIGD